VVNAAVAMKLASLCSILPGYAARAKLDRAEVGGTLAIQLGDVRPEGAIETAGLSRVALADVAAKYFVSPGDVVFRSRGESTTAAALDDSLAEPALVILPLIILRPNPQRLDAGYLAWAINQQSAQRQLREGSQGGAMRMVAKPALAELDVPVPDLRTQRAVVEAACLAHRQRDLERGLADLRERLTGAQLAQHCESFN